ncbi:hypothetical protein HPO96_14180 [Kribbella sandramycini]|uniref:Uncharacterized protein n=1 Tax=Kribbella sandramycini TaxID=60450 RepID=A0A7Y4NZA2_9ACTN|nr:hypothetical protein [Kribbella sandramycini]MBB6565122.1 hypothetical protein [Kribbella sandramycini]NOL41391.1 hypothetical protein [Kribbella sandramycini]
MKTPEIDAAVRALAPQHTSTISNAAWAELADAVVSADAAAVRTARAPRRPRMLIALAASLLIVGLVGAALVSRPGQNQPQALSFTERGDKIIVRVVDFEADAARYTADFQRMGLDIKVNVVPVSPPFVGQLSSFSGRTEQDTSQFRLLAPGEACNGTLTAADPGCQDGLEVPKNYNGKSTIEFGRTAKPGEQYYHTSLSATDKGELLEGLNLDGLKVGDAVPLVKTRAVQQIGYLVETAPSSFDDRQSVPADWYVHGTQTLRQGEVSLFVGPRPS